MIENQTMDQHQKVVKLETVDRLLNIPVVESGWNYVGQAYIKLKESNNVLNWTFEQAEVSLHSALCKAMPAINLFHGPITAIDKLLNQGLEKVEEKVPVITSPPDMIYFNTKQYVNDVVLKNAIVTDIMKKADHIKFIALENKYTGLAAETVDNALNVAEKYLNIYLPAGPNDVEKEDVCEKTTANSSMEKALHTMQHIDKISRKLQRRLTQRTLAEAKALKEHSAEAIHALLDILKLIAADPKLALQKGQEVWENLSEPESDNHTPPKTIDEVVFMLTRESARRAVHFINFTSGFAKQLPNQINTLTNKCIHLLEDIIRNVHLESINKTIYDSARISAQKLTLLLHQLNIQATKILEQAAKNLEEHKKEENNLSDESKHKHLKHRTPHKKTFLKNRANGIEN